MFQQKKIIFIIFLLFLCFSFFIILRIFNKNIIFYLSPSDVILKNYHLSKEFRIGGFVKKNCVTYLSNGGIRFVLADKLSEIVVLYNGIMPKLFREEANVIVFGYMDYSSNIFYAQKLFIKHNEYYQPKRKCSIY